MQTPECVSQLVLDVVGAITSFIGDVVDLFDSLTETQRNSSHWSIAIRMLDQALIEPAYLKTATLSLQTALAMDGLLPPP